MKVIHPPQVVPSDLAFSPPKKAFALATKTINNQATPIIRKKKKMYAITFITPCF